MVKNYQAKGCTTFYWGDQDCDEELLARERDRETHFVTTICIYQFDWLDASIISGGVAP